MNNVYNFYDNIRGEWYGDRAMDNSCRSVKNECGVYAIMLCDIMEKTRKLVYVGYSSKLKSRIGNHELLRFLRITYSGTDIIPMVRYCLADNAEKAMIIESELICKYDPLYNIKR